MTVTTHKITTRMDGATLFAEANNEIDAQIKAFANTVTPLGEEIGGGTQIDGDGSSTDLSAITGDSSRKLAPGELKVTTRTGGPIDLRQMDDPGEAVVTLPSGMTVGLDQCLRLGLVNVSPDGTVSVRNTAAPTTKAAPAEPISLGPRWHQHRMEQGHRVDDAFLSLLNTVTSEKKGNAMDFALKSFNENLGLNLNSNEEVKTVFNTLAGNFVRSMGEQLRQADPDTVADKGEEFVEALLEIMPKHEKINLLNRALKGDRSWVNTAFGILKKEARRRSS